MPGKPAETVPLFLPTSERDAASTRSSTGSTANFCSKTERIGRDGSLDLSFEYVGGVTRVASCRFTHPLQVVAPFYAPDGSAWMMLLNVSGGLVGGDRLDTKIAIGQGAHVLLTTAAASKAYRSEHKVASVRTTITLSENATLEYLPDHLIPHNGAAVDQILRIDLAPGARAIVYDAFAAGRVGRGERWEFRSLVSEVTITRHGVPLYVSRSRITPALQPLIQKGWMENANYAGALVVAGDGDVNWSGLAADLHTALQRIGGIRGGTSELSHEGCVAKFMCVTADALKGTVDALWRVARRALLQMEAFSLRKM